MRPNFQERLTSNAALRESLALLFFALTYALVFPGVAAQIGTHYYGGARQDAGIYIWLTEENIRHFFAWPSSGFDAAFFYPWGKALGYTDNYLLPSLVSMPVRLLTGNLTLAVNFAFYVAFVLNGYFTYRLLHLLSGSRLAGLLAGFAFMCQPFLYSQLGHSQLQFSYCFPAAAWAVCSFAKSRSALSASGIGAAVAAGFFSSAYYGLFCYVFAGLALLLLGVMHFRTLRVRDFFTLTIANLPWIGLLALTIPSYLAVRQAFGSWNLWVAKRFSGTLTMYLGAPSRLWFWGSRLHQFARTEGQLFVGITVLLMAAGVAVWVIFKLSRKELTAAANVRRAYAWLAFFAIEFALILAYGMQNWGLALHKSPILNGFAVGIPLWEIMLCLLLIFGLRAWTRKSDAPLEVVEYALLFLVLTFFFYFASMGVIEGHGPLSPKPGLYSHLFNLMPGFNSLRAVSRIGIVTNFCLVVLAGLAFAELLKNKTRNVQLLSCAALLLLMGLEYHPVHYPLEQMEGPPEIYQRLAKIPGNEAVIALPYGRPESLGWYSQLQTEHMQWLQAAGVKRPMFNGYSGKMPETNVYTDTYVKNFPDQTSLNFLGRFVGLRYLLYYRIRVSNFHPPIFEKAIAAMGEQLEVMERDPEFNYIFKLNPTVDVFSRSPAELYLPIDMKHRRKLRFEVQYQNPNSADGITLPLQVGWNIDPELIKTPAGALLTIDKANVWQPAELEIVHSTHSVVPHKVIFQPLDLKGGKVLIRHLEVITP